jgi:hypothetical protein
MPNIETYEAPSNLGISPSETGVESTARAAQRINLYGSQQAQDITQTGERIGRGVASVGDAAMQYMDHRQISAGAANGATLIAGLNESWNQTAKNADPNDPSTAAKWREETLEPALEKFQQGFVTEGAQQWAERFVDSYRQHAVVKTQSDMSSLAGEAVHVNAMQTVNGLATAAFNDPSTVNFAKGALAHSLDGLIGSSPNITAEDAGKVKTELQEKGEEAIVKAGIQGAILKGGDWQHIANDPANAPYVNGAETMQFERQEKQYQTSMRIMGNQERIQQKQMAEDSAHTAINDSFSKNVSTDATGKVTINPQFISDMAKIPLQHRNAPDAVDKAETQIRWAESQQKPAAVSDNADAVSGLLQVASDPTKSVDDVKIAVQKAEIAKGITPQTSAHMQQLATDMRNINDPLVKNALKIAEEKINPKFGGIQVNPDGYAAFYYNFIHNTYLPAKVAGTLAPNALDVSDPKSMISQAIAAVPTGPGGTLAPTISANGGIGAKPPASKAPAAPTPGEIRAGFRFKGGNPGDPKSWEPVT